METGEEGEESLNPGRTRIHTLLIMRCALCPCATTFDHNLGYSLLYYVIPQGRISYSKCYKTYDRMHWFLSEIFNIGEQKNWSMFALDAILSHAMPCCNFIPDMSDFLRCRKMFHFFIFRRKKISLGKL